MAAAGLRGACSRAGETPIWGLRQRAFGHRFNQPLDHISAGEKREEKLHLLSGWMALRSAALTWAPNPLGLNRLATSY